MHRPRRTLAIAFTTLAAACGEPSSTVEGSTADLTTQLQDADKVVECHGSEPFWDITIDAKTVKFTDGSRTMTIENRGPRSAAGFISSSSALYQGRTLEDPQRFLNVMIRNDGTSLVAHVLSGADYFLGGCGPGSDEG